jgi:hypothetical protein
MKEQCSIILFFQMLKKTMEVVEVLLGREHDVLPGSGCFVFDLDTKIYY